jgi:hypothetical protein
VKSYEAASNDKNKNSVRSTGGDLRLTFAFNAGEQGKNYTDLSCGYQIILPVH